MLAPASLSFSATSLLACRGNVTECVIKGQKGRYAFVSYEEPASAKSFLEVETFETFEDEAIKSM